MGWDRLGRGIYYRTLPGGAWYAPDTTWPTSSGRFDDGVRTTLYVSTTSEAAVAEFLRPNPSLLKIWDVVRIRLYELDIEVVGRVMDVVDPKEALAQGIDPERLTSSDPDPVDRYRECRELAEQVEVKDGLGIRFPCAALVEHPPNVVVFGEPHASSWVVQGSTELPRPLPTPAAALVPYEGVAQ